MRRLHYIVCLILFALYPAQSLSLDSNQSSSPQANPSKLQIAGLHDQVRIYRDNRWIPYIEATNEADVYFAQGYITASDRLWQMDLLRRTGCGELSQIFGRATLEQDKRYRVYGFAAVCQRMVEIGSPEVRKALESYSAGVNAFIDSCGDDAYPAEFRILKYKPAAWKPSDSLVVGKVMSVALSSSWSFDVTRAMISDLPEARRSLLLSQASVFDVVIVGTDKRTQSVAPKSSNQPSKFAAGPNDNLVDLMKTMKGSLERVGLYADDRAASNNWVVSGKRSATGKPLLANDPHLSASAPSIWYLAQLNGPGLRVAGVTIPGIPGILIGHNESIAWGATNLMADVQDLYVEQFDPEKRFHYKTPNGWAEAQIRREEIKVRKSATDTSTDVVAHQVVITRHGPIIFEQAGRRYALRWTALDPDSGPLEAFYRINRASNWEEFRTALSRYGEPAQNFVYADLKGHIGYYGAGKIPIRRGGDGSLPFDGSSDSGEWVGAIAFERLPHLYDPRSGVIVTANNRIVGDDYPYSITLDWAPPYRARRVFDLLQAKQKLTMDDCRSIQSDTYSISGAVFARETVKIAGDAAQTSHDEKWMEALHSFKTWNGHVDADSRVAPIIGEMRQAFLLRTLEAAMGAQRARTFRLSNIDVFVDRMITDRPREWLPKEFKDYAEFLRACYGDARAALTKRIGADEAQWVWGNAKYAQVYFPHPLSEAPFIGQRFSIAPTPQNGSASSLPTVNVGAQVSMRFIAQPGDWDKTRQSITLGQSGDASSPHWKDQLSDWLGVRPRDFPFSKSAVTEQMKTILVLDPRR